MHPELTASFFEAIWGLKRPQIASKIDAVRVFEVAEDDGGGFKNLRPFQPPAAGSHRQNEKKKLLTSANFFFSSLV